MDNVIRISAQEVRRKVMTGGAFLVCAYNDEEKYKTMRLEGAISFREFLELKPGISRDREIIFYCA